jgi:hypothetical protein
MPEWPTYVSVMASRTLAPGIACEIKELRIAYKAFEAGLRELAKRRLVLKVGSQNYRSAVEVRQGTWQDEGNQIFNALY